ncbi:hypothetical protein P8452_61937 [Trifolium repens]|nr:hypothetical protein P8452_61937 [Trifolium repens]
MIVKMKGCMSFEREKNQQQSLRQETTSMPSSGGSHERRKVISVEAVSNPRRYPDHFKNARNVALREVNSTNLVNTKGHGPKGMKAEVWDGLVDIWLKPEWKKKSDANRCNRTSLPDAVLHT